MCSFSIENETTFNNCVVPLAPDRQSGFNSTERPDCVRQHKLFHENVLFAFCVCIRRAPNKCLQCSIFMYGIAWSLVLIAKAPSRDSSTDMFQSFQFWGFQTCHDMSCMSGRFPGWSLRLMQMHQCLPTLHPCLSCICRHLLVHLQAEHLSHNMFSIVLFRLWTLKTLETWTGEALRTRSVTFEDAHATALEHCGHMRKDTAGDSWKADREKSHNAKICKKYLRSQIMIRKNVPWEG